MRQPSGFPLRKVLNFVEQFLLNGLSQLADVRELKQRADCQGNAESRPDTTHEPCGPQGVAAQFKKVIVQTNPLESQHFPHQSAQYLFFRRSWSPISLCRDELRSRQRLPIYLPVRCQR